MCSLCANGLECENGNVFRNKYNGTYPHEVKEISKKMYGL